MSVFIENIKNRLSWVKDRRHWTESENEAEQLDKEIEILEVVLGAIQWEVQ